jgi:hypothetical protein
MAVKPFGLVFFPAFDWAISPTHPEREERLLFTRDQIVEEGLLDIPGIREYKPRLASVGDVGRVHIGVPDLASHVTDAHLVSAGGAITAAEAVLRGEVERAFALVRPPGHHAMRVVHGTRVFAISNRGGHGRVSAPPPRRRAGGDRRHGRAPRRRHPGYFLPRS